LLKENPNAARLLRLLAYFDNQSIQYDHFRAGISHGSPTWLHQLVSEEVVFEAAMVTLAGYCFVVTQPNSSSWSIHNCVHDWTLVVLNKDFDIQQYWYALACTDALINHEYPFSLEHLQYVPLSLHAKRLVHDRFIGNLSTDTLEESHNRKLLRVSKLLQGQCLSHASMTLYKLVLQGYENVYGPDHESTHVVIRHLGILYVDQGKLDEAEATYQRVLQAKDEAHSPDNAFIFYMYNSLGNLYKRRDMPSEAEAMLRKALDGFEKAYGTDDESTLGRSVIWEPFTSVKESWPRPKICDSVLSKETKKCSAQTTYLHSEWLIV
jgi:tetratricopeptide (TPR) repeat protein